MRRSEEVSGTQHLIQTVEILQQLAEVSDEMIEAQRDFEFQKIKDLCERNAELRPQLSGALSHLQAYTPQTDEEREIVGLTGPLLKKIRAADRVFTVWRGNLEMVRVLGAKMAGQAFINAESLAQSPTFDILQGLFEGVPAVVVAAGPSLDKNFHLLESIKDRAVIVTMNRCAKVFQRAGLKPHILLATDGNKLLPEHHLGGVGTEVLENLMCRFSVHPKMREVPRGRTFLFTDGSSHEAGIMDFLGKRTRPIGGGTVAHSCFQTAYYLGCDPIIIIGQDLAYSGDRVYSSNDVDGDQRLLVDDQGGVGAFTGGRMADGAARAETVSTGFALRTVPGWHGEPVPTSRGFARHIQYFETLIEINMQDRTIINATEGGAHIEGMTHMRLEDAIAEHIPDTTHNAFERIEEVHAAYEPALDAAEIGAKIKKVTQSMTRLERLARDCKKLVKSPRRDAKTVKRVKKKHAELRETFEAVEFLVRDVYLGLKSQMAVPDDQWELLEQEFDSLQRAAKKLLPDCRRAVEELP